MPRPPPTPACPARDPGTGAGPLIEEILPCSPCPRASPRRSSAPEPRAAYAHPAACGVDHRRCAAASVVIGAFGISPSDAAETAAGAGGTAPPRPPPSATPPRSRAGGDRRLSRRAAAQRHQARARSPPRAACRQAAASEGRRQGAGPRQKNQRPSPRACSPTTVRVGPVAMPRDALERRGGWNYTAANASSGAYGHPQARRLKMSHGGRRRLADQPGDTDHLGSAVHQGVLWQPVRRPRRVEPAATRTGTDLSPGRPARRWASASVHLQVIGGDWPLGPGPAPRLSPNVGLVSAALRRPTVRLVWTTPRWLLGCLSAALLVLAGVTVAPDPAAGRLRRSPAPRPRACVAGSRRSGVRSAPLVRGGLIPTDWAATCSAKALGLDSDVVELALRLPSDRISTRQDARRDQPDSRGRYTPVIVVHGWTSRATHTTTRDGAFLSSSTSRRIAWRPRSACRARSSGNCSGSRGSRSSPSTITSTPLCWVDDVHLGPALGRSPTAFIGASGERVIPRRSFARRTHRSVCRHADRQGARPGRGDQHRGHLGTRRVVLAALLADGAAERLGGDAPSLAVVRLIAQCGRSSASPRAAHCVTPCPPRCGRSTGCRQGTFATDPRNWSELKPWPRHTSRRTGWRSYLCGGSSVVCRAPATGQH